MGMKPADAARAAGMPDSQGLRDVLSGRKRLTVELLSSLAATGIDLLFVVTGERGSPIGGSFDERVKALKESADAAAAMGAPELRDDLYRSRELRTLIANYTKCSVEDQIAILRLAESAASASTRRRTPSRAPKADTAVHEDSPSYAHSSGGDDAP